MHCHKGGGGGGTIIKGVRDGEVGDMVKRVKGTG